MEKLSAQGCISKKFPLQEKILAHRTPCNDEDDEPQTEDIDDDLAMTQTEISTTCPISKMEMKKPVKNSACGHVYDKASIEHILRHRPGSICPVVGCPNKRAVQMDHLKEDKATKRAIAKKGKN